jgi:hypothetical protein
MFESLRNGWEIGKQSFGVLRANKKLLVFPLLSGIACLIVLLSFALPLANSPQAQALFNDQQAPEDPLAYVLLFAFYFVNYFVIVFFNAALVSCAILHFNGEEPTLRDGLGAAMSALPYILGWALVSATVGVILRVIESRSERVGQFVAGLLGMAWSIVTYFVVPILVVEKVGPIEAVKRSGSIMRRTWGESLSAHFGVGLIIFLLCLVALIPAVIGFLIGNTVAVVAGLVITVVLWIVLALISAAVHTIAVAALYQYAAQRTVPQGFDAQQLEGAFGARA